MSANVACVGARDLPTWEFKKSGGSGKTPGFTAIDTQTQYTIHERINSKNKKLYVFTTVAGQGQRCLALPAVRTSRTQVKLNGEERKKTQDAFADEVKAWKTVYPWNSELFAEVYAIVRYQGKNGIDRVGLLMRYYPAGNLYDSVPPLIKEQKRTVALDILRIAALFYEKNAAHRDMKPANLLLTNNYDHVRLIDLASAVFSLDVPANKKKAQLPFGTPVHCAPEVATHSTNKDVRMRDAFSVGTALWKVIDDKDSKKLISEAEEALDKEPNVNLRIWDILETCAKGLRNSRDSLSAIAGMMMWPLEEGRLNARDALAQYEKALHEAEKVSTSQENA